LNGQPAKPAPAVEDRLATFETEPREESDVERRLEAGFPAVVVEDESGVVAGAPAPRYPDSAVYAGVRVVIVELALDE
jgi:L-amino acid N-acyltransferase YncA